MQEPTRHLEQKRRPLPPQPDRPVHPGVIRDQKRNETDRWPHVPSPEPSMPYWPGEEEHDPRRQPPDVDERRGVENVDYRV